jgi:hypothetical protein
MDSRYRSGHCARCRRWHPLPARGLCGACYRWVYGHGHLDRYPRRTRTRDELMTEWEPLSVDHSIERAAPRLGVTEAALDRAITRARKAGDPRARLPRWGSRIGVLPAASAPERVAS